MKYYSEVTKKFYDNEQVLLEDEERVEDERARREKAQAELTEKRKARAAEIDEARKAMVAAQKKYEELVEAFCKDYKSYHYSCSSFDELPSLFKTWFSNL